MRTHTNKTGRSGLRRLGGVAAASALICTGAIASLAPAAPASGAIPPLPALTASIGGRVAMAKTGEGLPGADVMLLRAGKVVGQTSADKDGLFLFDGLWPGTYTIEVDGAHSRRLNVGVFAAYVEIDVH